MDDLFSRKKLATQRERFAKKKAGAKSYVEAPDNDSLDCEEAVTVEFWMNPGPPAPGYSGIVWKATSDGGPYNYFIETWDNANQLYLSYTHASNNNDFIASVTGFDKGTWYHIAGVIDPPNGKEQLYVDGKLDAEKDISSEDLETNDDPLWIGRRFDAFFDGIIDEVVIYNRALTEDEIKDDMSGISAAVSYSGKLATTWGIIKKHSASFE